jgi:hypothetical protein
MERIQRRSGRWYLDVFRDFLQIVEVSLDRLPALAVEVADSGRAGSDSPELQDLWAPLRQRYSDDDFAVFAEAFAHLLNCTTFPEGGRTFADLLGTAYMTFVPSGKGGNHRAQYFTPWSVAHFMAQMLLDVETMEQDAITRLVAASERAAQDDPSIQALTLSLGLASQMVGDSPETTPMTQRFIQELLDRIRPYLEPITMLDPASGSGIMLLAWASVLPPHWLGTGLFQFYGIDIDATCCAMARINCRLYGLGSQTPIIPAQHLSVRETEAIPPPYGPLYREVAEASTEAEVAAIVERIEAVRSQQLTLFEQGDSSASERPPTQPRPRRKREERSKSELGAALLLPLEAADRQE